MKVAYRNLMLGDRVRLDGIDAYSDATVIDITDKEITLFRPYVQVSDFTYTGGLIPYIGIEKFNVWRDSDTEVLLLHRLLEVPR